MDAYKILELAYNKELAQFTIDSFKEVENNFYLKKWKTSELDAGHFVEAVRRIIEQELYLTYTPIGRTLINFNEVELKKYESATTGDESFRMIIPRVLFSINTIRNKRGVGHIGLISPNELDATYIIQAVKWTLGEIIRLKSNLSIKETQLMVEEIIERKVYPIWKDGDRKRILDNTLNTQDKILILLFDEDKLTDKELQKIIGYKNTTDFVKLLNKMNNQDTLLIDYHEGICKISPHGITRSEYILL